MTDTENTQILIPKWFTYAFAIIYIFVIYHLASACLTKDLAKNFMALTICIFLLLKWATDARECTVSYAECKIRGVKKEQGFVNNLMEGVINLNKHKLYRVIQIIVILVAIVNFMHARDEYLRISGLYGHPGFITLVYNIMNRVPPNRVAKRETSQQDKQDAP